MATACVVAAPSGCFRVEELPACADTTGLYERSHVCMPLGIEVTLQGAPWLLHRAVFDGDGIDDVAVGVVTEEGRSVVAMTELGGEAKQAVVVTSPGLRDFVPSFVFGAASGVHDLATVIETGDEIEGGILTLHVNGGDVFASLEQAFFPLKGQAFGLPCVRPVSLAAVGDGVSPDFAWGVACESPAMPATGADIGYLVNPIIDGGGVFEAIGDPRFSNTHGMVAARLTDGAAQSIAFAAVPTDGKSDIIALAYDNDDNMVRPTDSVVEPDQGIISRVYAADLDGDEVDELVALHPKGDLITISRRVVKDPLAYETVDQDEYAGYFTVPSPLAAAFGDFTGDGEIDIAVAFDTEDGTGVGIYIRWPDQGEGLFYASLGALRLFALEEPVVDLVALAADDDDKLDLAVAQVTGAGGRLQVFLNRSLKPG